MNKTILNFIIFIITIDALFFSAQSNSFPSDALKSEILITHNALRACHQAPKLIWSPELALYAQNHADKCRFQHSGSSYGENLAAGYPTITAAINAWYAEGAHYSFNYPGFSYNTGHFTQLIWKESRQVGCGYSFCNGRNNTPGFFLVCEYNPHGNITNKGYFELNVLPKK